MSRPTSTAGSTSSSTAGHAAMASSSTIVACLGPRPQLLRPGAVTREAIEAALGSPIDSISAPRTAPNAPGQLASHYAPKAELRLGAARAVGGRSGARFRRLRSRARPRARGSIFRPPETSSRPRRICFPILRALDAAGAARIAVAPIPDHGLGAAINDRLRRAAAPRSSLNRPSRLRAYRRRASGHGKELAIPTAWRSAETSGDRSLQT